MEKEKTEFMAIIQGYFSDLYQMKESLQLEQPKIQKNMKKYYLETTNFIIRNI